MTTVGGGSNPLGPTFKCIVGWCIADSGLRPSCRGWITDQLCPLNFGEPPLSPRLIKASVLASGCTCMTLILSSSFMASRIGSIMASDFFCCLLEVTSNTARTEANTLALNATSEMASGVLSN